MRSINMRKMTQYASPWCKPEPEIRPKNCDEQNELCENTLVHAAILAYNFYNFVCLSLVAPICTFLSSQVRTISPNV